jgi:hypothetical protein
VAVALGASWQGCASCHAAGARTRRAAEHDGGLSKTAQVETSKLRQIERGPFWVSGGSSKHSSASPNRTSRHYRPSPTTWVVVPRAWGRAPRTWEVALRTEIVVQISSKWLHRPVERASGDLGRTSQVVGAIAADLLLPSDVVDRASSSLKSASNARVRAPQAIGRLFP